MASNGQRLTTECAADAALLIEDHRPALLPAVGLLELRAEALDLIVLMSIMWMTPSGQTSAQAPQSTQRNGSNQML
jgi:hypothetical protein